MKHKLLISFFYFLLFGMILFGCSEDNEPNKAEENKVEENEVGQIVDKKNKTDIFEQDYSINVNNDIINDIGKVIDDYTEAYNKEDVDGYLEHFYNENEELKVVLSAQLESLFNMFNIESTVDNYSVVGKSEEGIIKVKINMTTKSIEEDSEFTDNKSESYQYFKNIDNKWFFIKTEIISEEIL